jgi:lysophospholipid acyltransferase 1/2
VKPGNKRPSPRNTVLFKLLTSFFFAFLVIAGTPLVPTELLVDDNFLNTSSFWYIVLYMVASTTAARFKYFLAWKLGETVCNTSGLGFNGYNENGTENWDLMSNISVLKFETSLNFKGVIDYWNRTTQSWLRRCAYERTNNKYRTLVTYVMSAVWHGFWPGYYLTFLTGALVTTAARNARRGIRPFFQKNRFMALCYDLITCLMTRVYLAYTVAPFVLLSLENGLKLYSRLYFFGHIQCLFAIFVLPALTSARQSSVEKVKSG